MSARFASVAFFNNQFSSAVDPPAHMAGVNLHVHEFAPYDAVETTESRAPRRAFAAA